MTKLLQACSLAVQLNRWVSALALVGVVCSMSSSAAELRRDPALVKGPNECGECHKDSVQAWKQSHHAKTFKTLPRSKKARKIANKLGIKRIKSESACLTCHFTSQTISATSKPIAGISCESCHGAGKEWMDTHSDFGGKDVKAENESSAHKQERYRMSDAAGMIRPSHLYALAENCYSCHTVPNEELVNVGGHAAGSAFELVRWSQGEVRHNLWYRDGNPSAPPERQRMLYVIGKMLDYEYALRGVAKATKKATYAIKMAKRAKIAQAYLKKIAGLAAIPEVKQVLATASKVSLKLNNEQALSNSADEVSKSARAFAKQHDGSQLAALDALLPSADKYKGKAFKP